MVRLVQLHLNCWELDFLKNVNKVDFNTKKYNILVVQKKLLMYYEKIVLFRLCVFFAC
jgi:hypothetical protein